MNQHPTITHASQLPELSTWRRYKEGIRELELWEAPKSVIQDFRHQAARSCFLAFADIMKEGHLKVADFHEIIASAFEDLVNRRYRRLIISCPPRSGKSMLSALFVAWLLGIDGASQHIISSYGQQLSSKLFKEVLTYLKNPAFKKVFPEWGGFEQNSKYDMVSGGYILNTSVGGVLTGFSGGTPTMESPGIGVSLIDDPLKSSASKAAFDELENWWKEELSTRRTNRYAQLLVGTRFHERDLHGVLMETDGIYDPEENPNGWRWINIRGIIDTEEQANDDILGRQIGETHWPENPAFTKDSLDTQRRTMGTSAFYSLYMGSPVSKKGQIVKAGWVHTVEPEGHPGLDFVWFGIDCAFSESENADETAICVAGISFRDPSTVYIKELVKGKWGFPDLIAQVKLLYSYYKPRILCIEKAASGQSLIQMLKRETKIAVEEMKPLRSKTKRLEAVCPLLEAGRVKLIDGSWVTPFVKELTSFPFSNHDDSTDAFTWALTYYVLKMDSSDRSANDAIMNLKKLRGDTQRAVVSPSYRGRGINAESHINDPDYGGSPFGYGNLSRGRRSTGYEIPLG